MDERRGEVGVIEIVGMGTDKTKSGAAREVGAKDGIHEQDERAERTGR